MDMKLVDRLIDDEETENVKLSSRKGFTNRFVVKSNFFHAPPFIITVYASMGKNFGQISRDMIGKKAAFIILIDHDVFHTLSQEQQSKIHGDPIGLKDYAPDYIFTTVLRRTNVKKRKGVNQPKRKSNEQEYDVRTEKKRIIIRSNTWLIRDMTGGLKKINGAIFTFIVEMTFHRIIEELEKMKKKKESKNKVNESSCTERRDQDNSSHN